MMLLISKGKPDIPWNLRQLSNSQRAFTSKSEIRKSLQEAPTLSPHHQAGSSGLSLQVGTLSEPGRLRHVRGWAHCSWAEGQLPGALPSPLLALELEAGGAHTPQTWTGGLRDGFL